MMKRFHYAIVLLLSLLLLSTLHACTKNPVGETDRTPPVTENGQSAAQPEVADSTGEYDLRLGLPEGLCADICNLISAEELTLFISAPSDSDSTEDMLLDGVVDLALLSAQTAADLYRRGYEIQVMAVVSPGSPDNLDGMECLVCWNHLPREKQDLLARFCSAYTQTAQEQNIEGYFLATGWDMLDLVGQNLEEQYAQNPGPDRGIPDSNFYYLPS